MTQTEPYATIRADEVEIGHRVLFRGRLVEVMQIQTNAYGMSDLLLITGEGWPMAFRNTDQVQVVDFGV